MLMLEVKHMARTVKVGDLANPQMRVRMHNGKMSFIKVGKGNPQAIKAQQERLTSCARSAAGLKGQAFRDKVKSCAKK